jgi:glycosyltransferase involved in cell wall biosynthesis
MRISTLMPSRNRPENLRRIFDSALKTVYNKDLFEFCIRLDDDDVLSDAIIQQYKHNLYIRVAWGKGRQERWGTYWNDAWKITSGEIYGMIGDDFIYRTPGWDIAIRDEFKKRDDRILFVFGDDLFQKGKIGTHGFIHKKWTDTLGYYAPMQFKSYCHDHWIDDIADRVGRKLYRPDLVFEHMHHLAKKATRDEVYRAMAKNEIEDLVTWAATEPIRVAEAEKFKGVMIK